MCIRDRDCTVGLDGLNEVNLEKAMRLADRLGGHLAVSYTHLDVYKRQAYVLLGEPGAGKTTAFHEEARAAGCEAIPARDFIAIDRPEWRGWTLFIDGLDEMRAGSTASSAIRRACACWLRP